MARPDKLQALAAHAYAHRGLHGDGVPENTLSAFRAAMAAGLGIECDIRKSSDGRAVVFHDAELERLTGRAGAMGARSVGDLTAIMLTGSEETIPTLRDALDLVAGKVPLLLEVKSDDRRPVDAICRAVRRDLDGYQGLAAVMSFDPRVPRWFAEHEPDVLRGLVVSEQDSRTLVAAIKRKLSVAHALRVLGHLVHARAPPLHPAARHHAAGAPRRPPPARACGAGPPAPTPPPSHPLSVG